MQRPHAEGPLVAGQCGAGRFPRSDQPVSNGLVGVLYRQCASIERGFDGGRRFVLGQIPGQEPS